MSRDLIERLRDYTLDWRDRAASKDVVDEAMAEISRLRAELSSLRGEGEPVAYMRKWSFDGDEGTRDNRPRGWTLHAVTKTKLLDDDIPLYAHPTPDSDVIGRLVNLVGKASAMKVGPVAEGQRVALFFDDHRDAGKFFAILSDMQPDALASIPSTEGSKS